jgi:hypothetical protein
MNIYLALGLGSALAASALALDEAVEWLRDAPGKNYTQTRAKFVRTALSNAEPVNTLVLGDSISESTWLYDVCGKTFNASVAGAKIADVASLAPIAVQRTRPNVIVLEVGTNNLRADPRPSDDFKRQYLALVGSLPGRKILVGFPNSPAGSSFVRRVAGHIDATYVEPVTGKLTHGSGVHPTREGAMVYRQRIQQACASRLRPS